MNTKTIIFRLLCLVLCVFSTQIALQAKSSSNNTIQLLLYQGDDDNDDDPLIKGRRDAPVPVICEIDFEQGTVSGASLPDDVEEYQIWDASATMSLSISTDAAAFVEALKSLPARQTYIIRLIAPAVTLSGNIYLE